MSTPQPVIVDTNILFSALLSSSSGFADALLKSGHPFFVCEQVLVELFEHKEKIVHASHLSEDEIVRLYHILMRRINVYKEDLIAPEHWTTAYALCCDIDESDTPHVALTFALGGLLWTGDKKLKEGLKRKGFDSFFQTG
jgi:predicted nucleic acid-binding protein